MCFTLEGTYPFVSGGVSSWVHHLVRHMPELKFAVLHISPSETFYGGRFAYELPDNVLWVRELGLQVPKARFRLFRPPSQRAAIAKFWQFVERIRTGDSQTFNDYVAAFGRIKDGGVPNAYDFLNSEESWEVLVQIYRDEADKESFLNFFWTWRFAYQPLLNVLTYDIPEAGMYHTVSTGYAGILASAAKLTWDRPMVLTEHGIYTKERRIEIHTAKWIQDWESSEFIIENSPPYFKQFWNRHFATMSKICYENANRIYTLYNDNTKDQMRDGADPDKLQVIPNGIDIEKLVTAGKRKDDRPPNDRFTVGFVGRVCPIKDVKTFIAAIALVKKSVPDVLARILGPMEEDKEYAEDCQRFAAEMELQDNLRFEGRVDIAVEMPKLDVLVLTSISEAQPLVVLEGGAVGLPVVATDVGSCRELLEGRSPEDRRIGVGGLLTPIASPGATAQALLQLHADPGFRKQMGANLQERVIKLYDQKDMVRSYLEIYRDCVAQSAG